GIGANTAMFSVVRAVLLRPLPFPDADHLMSVSELNLRHGRSPSSASWPDYRDWRSRVQTLSGISAYHDARVTLVGRGLSQHVPGAIVSADFFSTLSVQPVMGRAFRAREENAGPNVVVVSDTFWRSQLGSAPDAIGREIRLNGRSFSVIGVMPPGF